MKKNIFVKGPFLSQSGYGEQARFALRALRSKEELFNIYLHPINWGQTGWVWEDTEFRRWVDQRILQTQIAAQNGSFRPDITLQITIPNEFQKMSPMDIGFTAGVETTKVSPQWLQSGNLIDKILVVSNHAKTTYQSTSVMAQDPNGNPTPYSLMTPVKVVNQSTVRTSPEEIKELELEYDNNFLVISQMGARKNFTNTINWFIEEFKDEEVGLIVKTNIKSNCLMDKRQTEHTLRHILKNSEDRKCKVYLLHGDLTPGQMTGLYNNDKIISLINIAHGEGYGLPLFEAAREGLPVVTIGWSGQLDFLHHKGEDYFENVEFSLYTVAKDAVWDGVIQPDSMWAYADEGSYKKCLRNTLQNLESVKNRALTLKSIIESEFSDDKLYTAFVDAILEDQNNTVTDEELDELFKELI